MTWVDIVWPMIAAACLTLALIHLVIWQRRREQPAHLLFFFAAASVAGIAMLELVEFRASAPEVLAAAIRWAHPLLAIFMISVVAIVRLEYRAGRRWLAWTVGTMRVAALFPNFLVGENLNFYRIIELRQVEFWGSGPLTVAVVEPSPALLLGQLSNLLLVIFLLDAIFEIWRREDSDKRRAGMLVVGSFAASLLVAGTLTAIVSLGLVPLPLSLNPWFLPVLLAMSYGLSSDVVRAAQLSQQLSSSEARLQRVIEAAPAGMLIVAADQRIVLVNVQAERILGRNRGQLLGLDVAALLPLPEPPSASCSTHPEGIAGQRQEISVHRPDGTELPIELRLSPLDAHSADVLWSMVDLSERIRSEQAIAQHRAELTHLSRVAAIGELSGSIAHELTQPLTAILSNAQAAVRLLGSPHADIADVHECLTAVIESDKRAGEVIRRLRRMLKNEDIDLQPLSLNEVVLDTLRLARSDLRHREVRVETELADGLPMVGGDKVQLQQVLLNLLLNACDAMEHLEQSRCIRFGTRLAEPGWVEITVSDAGVGLDPEQIQRIFEPFVTSKRDGLGLGLAVTRTIVNLHHGRLDARNNQDAGATFSVGLPIMSAERRS